MHPLTPERLVRGQYESYRNEAGVAADSNVETFVALESYIDSWRWSGVPFYIRAGKCLPVTATEVIVELKRPPQNIFDDVSTGRPSYLRFRLGPDRVAIALGARTKVPGEQMRGKEIELSVCNDGREEMLAYERLIGDALRGDHSLFARRDSIEAAWAVVNPVLQGALPVYPYRCGTWGPAEAYSIFPRNGVGKPDSC